MGWREEGIFGVAICATVAVVAIQHGRSPGHVALWGGGALLAWTGYVVANAAISKLIPDVASARFNFWQMCMLTLAGIALVVTGATGADRSMLPWGIITVIVSPLWGYSIWKRSRS